MIKIPLFQVFIYVLIVICIYLCGVQSSFAKNNVYFYEPMEVELDGTIAKKKIDCNCSIEKYDYEGRTGGVIGYDNDYNPDNNFRVMRNECVFLLLDEPIDVKKPDHYFAIPVNSKKNSTPENNVEVLQMTNNDNINPNFDIGDRVHVRGSLYRHFQNCDRSRVLIDVIDIKVVENGNNKTKR